MKRGFVLAFAAVTAASLALGGALAQQRAIAIGTGGTGGVYYPITQISQIQRAYEDIVVQLRTAYNLTFKSDAVGASGVSSRLKIKAKRDNTFATIHAVWAAE